MTSRIYVGPFEPDPRTFAEFVADLERRFMKPCLS